jgi:hypothetical protein
VTVSEIAALKANVNRLADDLAAVKRRSRSSAPSSASRRPSGREHSDPQPDQEISMDIPAMFETARPIVIAFGSRSWRDHRLHRRPDADRLRFGLVMKALERQKVEPTIDPLHRNDHQRRAEHHPGGGDPRLLRRRDHVVRRSRGGLGIAVGAAWGGLLSNFAAGAFILVLRPFKVGDYVVAGESKARCASSACSTRRSTRPTTCRRSWATRRS